MVMIVHDDLSKHHYATDRTAAMDTYIAGGLKKVRPHTSQAHSHSRSYSLSHVDP
jgi:hypothetical protein